MSLIKSLTLVLFLFCAMPSVVMAAQSYVEDLVDLPLMEGLSLVDDAGFVFEQENGRIVEKMAMGAPSTNSIAKFYADALPQLGWTNAGNNTFTRDKEELSLTFRKEGALSVVIFHLNPTP